MAKAKSREKRAPRAARIRLSKAQRSLLERATRNAGLIAPAPRGNELRTAQSLLDRGLLLEARTQPHTLERRRDPEAMVPRNQRRGPASDRMGRSRHPKPLT